MNFIVRRFRRWRYKKHCEKCRKTFMWGHECRPRRKRQPPIDYIGPVQDELNQRMNQRIDNIEIGGKHHV